MVNRFPPPKDGVCASKVVLPAGEWRSVLDFLAERFPKVARDEWRMRLMTGRVLDEDHNSVGADAAYRPRAHLYYYKRVDDEPLVPFEETVLYRDEHLIVADKPHFLPVISTGRYVQESLLARLQRKLRLPSLAPLHRIDRDTAGLVLFAILPETRGRYMSLFRERLISKTYEAIAPFRNELNLPLIYRSRLAESDAFMQMRAVAGEPNSESHIELLERRGDSALYRLRPITGKRHQLRAHLCALGIPILNDRIYPTLLPAAITPAELSHEYEKPLQLLARKLEFVDPITRRPLCFESQLKLAWPE